MYAKLRNNLIQAKILIEWNTTSKVEASEYRSVVDGERAAWLVRLDWKRSVHIMTEKVFDQDKVYMHNGQGRRVEAGGASLNHGYEIAHIWLGKLISTRPEMRMHRRLLHTVRDKSKLMRKKWAGNETDSDGISGDPFSGAFGPWFIFALVIPETHRIHANRGRSLAGFVYIQQCSSTPNIAYSPLDSVEKCILDPCKRGTRASEREALGREDTFFCAHDKQSTLFCWLWLHAEGICSCSFNLMLLLNMKRCVCVCMQIHHHYLCWKQKWQNALDDIAHETREIERSDNTPTTTQH